MFNKKIRVVLLLLIGFFSSVSALSFGAATVEAGSILDAPGVVIPGENETINSKYSFIAAFNDTKTVATPFGEANWRELSDDGSLKEQGYSSKVAVFNPRAVTDPDALKGTIGMGYSNVGTYEGKEIDLKVTLLEWSDPISNLLYGNIMFGLDMIAMNTQAYRNVKTAWTFYESGTDTKIKISGYMTFNDMDAAQELVFDQETTNKIAGIYINADTNEISFEDRDGEYAFFDEIGDLVDPDNQDRMFTFLYDEADTLVFSWGRRTANGVSDTTMDDVIVGDFFGYIAKKPARTETIPPVKKNSDTDEELVDHNHIENEKEQWLYTISHKVPDEYEKHYYSSYEFKDTLLPELEVVEGSLQITNELEEDASDFFEVITFEGNAVHYQATPRALVDANFYNHEYFTSFSAGVIEGADLTPYTKDGVILLENTAQVTINGTDTKDSNTTITEIATEEPEEPIDAAIRKVILDGTKEVELKSMVVGDRVVFVLPVTIPTEIELTSVAIFDDLEDVLDVETTGIRVLDADKTDITKEFTVEVVEEKEQVTVSAKEPQKWKGQSLSVHIPGLLKASDFQEYVDDNGDIMIPNVGELRVNDKVYHSNKVHVTVPQGKPAALPSTNLDLGNGGPTATLLLVIVVATLFVATAIIVGIKSRKRKSQ